MIGCCSICLFFFIIQTPEKGKENKKNVNNQNKGGFCGPNTNTHAFSISERLLPYHCIKISTHKLAFFLYGVYGVASDEFNFVFIIIIIVELNSRKGKNFVNAGNVKVNSFLKLNESLNNGSNLYDGHLLFRIYGSFLLESLVNGNRKTLSHCVCVCAVIMWPNVKCK